MLATPTTRSFIGSLLALVALQNGCVGHIGGDGERDGEIDPSADDDDGTTTEVGVSSSALRRLSVHELGHTLQAVVGFVPEAIDRIPPDGLGYSFDRVVNAQTVSPAHLDAFSAIASEVSTSLIAERWLDDVVAGCPDESVPSLVKAESKLIDGNGLSVAPTWAVGVPADPKHATTIYAPDVEAVYAHGFSVPGSYEISFAIDVEGTVDSAVVLVDAVPVATQTNVTGAQSVTATVDIALTGSHVVQLSLDTNPDDSSLRVVFESLAIVGPLDLGPAPPDADVKSCAASIIDELAPAAYRRPLSDDEHERLASLYDDLVAEHGTADALHALLEAIFSSPHFLFLVEIGEPVAGREGVFRLGAWELASRLSYAICEQPPDAVLWNAAAGGELETPDQIEAQARRLYAEPCAQQSVERFFEHWLWLNELPSLVKSQQVFPEFTEAVRDGMVIETKRFLHELVWNDEVGVSSLFDASYAWPDADVTPLYGLPPSDGQKTEMPAERAGILTSAGLLAVTGTFDGTSPVRRGVYVLEQILCAELGSPPTNVEIAPPPPDPNLTTRERWAAHTEVPECAVCHQAIDPIGFTLEEYDGIGRHRTTENGFPIDASGGVPAVGVADGEIVGGVALAEVLAASSQLESCVAKQWLRFSFGRLETPADAETIDAVAAAFDQETIREALVSIVSTDAFFHRSEIEE